MNRASNFLISCALLLGIAAHAPAAAILVPSGLSPGDPYHLVFVSSTSNTANYGGVAGADAFVQNLADIAGIGVTQSISWQAILSDNIAVTPTDAISRFSPAAPIYDTQGNLVAANGPALWNTASIPLVNPIAFDENGVGGIAIPREVWTGTNPGGTFDQADSDWLAATANTSATAGSSMLTGPGWINGGGYPTEIVPLSVFAASDLLRAPDAVPEPSSFVLAVLALVGLGCCRRRRRTV